MSSIDAITPSEESQAPLTLATFKSLQGSLLLQHVVASYSCVSATLDTKERFDGLARALPHLGSSFLNITCSFYYVASCDMS